MKKIFLLLLFIASITTITAQKTWTSRDSSTVAKLKKAIIQAEAKVEKAKIKVTLGDSLFQVGSSQLAEGKTTQKQLKTETKALNKQHSTDRKVFEKSSKSKNRDEASEAKFELKKIDTKYKAEAKILSNKTKVNNKLLGTAKRNLDKGKNYTKAYGKTLKDADKALKYAEAALYYKTEELNHIEEENPKKKNNKKK